MQVTIHDPELRAMIEEQVRSGHFASANELVAEALAQYMATAAVDDDLDDETVAALNESFEQAERGETISVEEAAARLGVTLSQRKGQSGAA
jgi:Arc/MetJ-type ribon-helix-helix transcriptional regulator